MNADFLQALSFQTVGVVIVMGSLGLLALAVVVIGRGLRLAEPKTVPGGDRAADAVLPVPPAGEGIPPEIRAVIAAAVVATLDGSYRVVEIKTSTDVRLQAWSLEGRRQIFSSHRVR